MGRINMRATNFLENQDRSSMLSHYRYVKIQDEIKKYLMDNENRNSWNEYVNKCEIGGCQYTAHAISGKFPQATNVFGEVEIDGYADDDEIAQTSVTHHWIEIDGYPYDFAKGTLSNYINWHDVYDPDLGNDDWRYHPIHKQGIDPKFKTAYTDEARWT